MQTNVQQQNEQVYLISNYSASPATAAVSVIISHGSPTAGHILGGILNRGPADPLCFARHLHCIILIYCSKLLVLLMKALINPYLIV